MITPKEKATYYQAPLEKSTEKDALSKIIGAAPTKLDHQHILKAAWLDTPLGSMIAIADDDALYLLEFVDRRGLDREVERLRLKTKSAIIPARTAPIESIEAELNLYFKESLNRFETPLNLIGSPFQKSVWHELLKIPPGETRSYLDLATTLGRPSSARAVARANATNQLAIVIPCHRVITHQGELGGYGGGLSRKKWLIQHENGMCNV